jgi:hypothetical protein
VGRFAETHNRFLWNSTDLVYCYVVRYGVL